MWARYYDTEKVYVQNNSPYPIDLNGWIIRDSAISAYRTLTGVPVIAAKGQPGDVQEVYSGDLNLNNLPATNTAFEGDAVYLMEPAGGGLGTGNLRAWFPYPCNPDDCGDPQKGQVEITGVQYVEPALQTPSAPGSVEATASTNGTGSITVRWAPPANLGGPSVTYTVTALSSNGGGPLPLPAPSGITGLEHTFSGLALGRAYSFTVKATNSAGTSPASDASGEVTPVGVPSAPTEVLTDAREAAVVVSWPASTTTGGTADLKYTARAVEDTSKFCEATDGVTSCVVGQLDPRAYTFIVTASNAVGSSGPSPASAATTPRSFTGSVTPPGKPTAVAARALDGRAVVSWLRPLDQPDAQGVRQPLSYEVAATPRVGGATRTCESSGATSCVVGSLTNGTPYTFIVTPKNQDGVSGSSSDPSEAVTPFPYVAGQTSTVGDPPPAATPWVGGQSRGADCDL